MNYEEALYYIENIQPLGFQLGLERIVTLLNRLGAPHENLKCIHVAGTNGKGSACSMLRHILSESGYRCGLYTSPHLNRYNERIEIDGIAISDKQFAKVADVVAKACKEMTDNHEGQPTVFEFLTAMAFYYFYIEKVDVVVLEVGLGGRFDATNVIAKPLLSLIMAISMDHMEYLGDNLGKIAFEKGGIIKENCPVVLYSQSTLVYNVIEDICRQKNAALFCTGNALIDVKKQDLQETIFSIQSPNYCYPQIRLQVLGDMQINNCAVVLTACAILQTKHFSKLNSKTIVAGIAKTRWQGRMEVLKQNPLVVIDGAHNVDGIRTLADSLPKYFPHKNITLILGMLGDKEYEKMVEILLPKIYQLILTEPQNQRKLSLEILEKTVSPYGKTFFSEEQIPRAYEKAKEITEESGVILAAGSLYMIGAIREHILNELKNGGKTHD